MEKERSVAEVIKTQTLLVRERCPALIYLFTIMLLGLASFTPGQNVVEDGIAPPPLRLLSQEEKNRLSTENDVKRRTRLALDLMELRLKQAETFDTAENYDEMFVQLGGFHGLMDNTLEFLKRGDKDSGKVLNNFKRFEIGLRGFTTRLELIRHHLPIKYEFYVRILVKNLRAARAKAIEPLFDDTVVPTKKPE